MTLFSKPATTSIVYILVQSLIITFVQPIKLLNDCSASSLVKELVPLIIHFW